MRRLSRLLVFLFLFVAGLPAQAPAQAPEDYKTPYADWLRNGARLERDAETARERLAARADRAAADAVKYETARQAFFAAERAQLTEASGKIQPLALPLETSADGPAKQFLATQDAMLAKNVAAFANDPDEGIQRLRRALDKERNALAAIKSTMDARDSAGVAVRLADDSVQRAAHAADEQVKTLADSFEQSAYDADKLGEAWRAYYRTLANGARGIAGANAGPLSALRPLSPAPQAPSSSSSASSQASLASSSPAPAQSAPSAPSAPVRPPNALPLTRYTGSWEFLKGISTYKGLPPFTFDMAVQFDNGEMTGTVSATFDVLPKADPSVKFTFSGPMQPGREQSFPLETAEGAKGQVDLIPTGTFNLLEVRFKLENAKGKVSESDVVLIKKL